MSNYTTFACIERFLPHTINTILNVLIPNEDGRYPKPNTYVASVFKALCDTELNEHINNKLAFVIETPELKPKPKAEKKPKADKPKKEAKPKAEKKPKAKKV